MIQLFGYCYVHVSGQRQADLDRENRHTTLGTMVPVMHVHFMCFAFFKNLKSFSEDSLPEHALEIPLKTPPKWFRLSN